MANPTSNASPVRSYILADDEDQAGDDLELAKKIITVNPILNNEVEVKQKIIERRDGKGFLEKLQVNGEGVEVEAKETALLLD